MKQFNMYIYLAKAKSEALVGSFKKESFSSYSTFFVSKRQTGFLLKKKNRPEAAIKLNIIEIQQLISG